MGTRGWVRAFRQLAARRHARAYPYGLLAPVARVATTETAEKVRAFLAGHGIRSTVAPSPPHWRRRGVRAQLHVQVLVFIEDVSLARHLVNLWAVPVQPA